MKNFKSLPFLISIALAFLFTNVAIAQNKSKKEADQAFNGNKYYQSIELYKKAYDKSSKPAEKAEILYQIGESYRNIDNPAQSIEWYKKALDANYPNKKALFWIAEAERTAGNYDEAISYYKKYEENVSGVEQSHVQSLINFCNKAKKWIDTPPTSYTVKPVDLINSQQYDFSPTIADKNNKSLIFTSTRTGSTGGSVSNVTGQSFADLFSTNQDDNGKWSEPIRLEGDVNTKYAEGASTLNSDDTKLFYTQCKNGKTGKYGCQILVSTKDGDKWGSPKVLKLAADSFVVGHPALSSNDKVLVFAADLPGGMGGKDLWYSTNNNGEWSKPVNLGSDINTPRDEMFPYIKDDGTLYFSSNGHPGMGGLDIFKAEKAGNHQWSNVQNMKAPINSPANDYGLIFKGNEDAGYFTSKRKGGKGGDDIWEFSVPPMIFTLKGIVKNAKTKEALEGATVQLVGSDGAVAEKTTITDGLFRFEKNGNERYINIETSYSIKVSKEGFLSATGNLTTVGIDKTTIFKQTYELQPIEGKIVLPTIVFDFDKSNITAQAADSLNYLYKVLIDNPNITIQLMSNTDYRGSDTYNKALAQRRAESSAAYLFKKGIEKDRIVAKGEGEEVPRTLSHDIKFLKKGTTLTEKFIKSLKGDEEKFEFANRLNRRTEFKVLRTDYKSKK